MSLKGKHCFGYTRVSSLQQVDGFSGKNISGRPEFGRMLRTIRSNPDVVDYILAYKLSRFGRSAADTLGTLKELKNFDVYLYSVEAYIDSASHLGELLVAFLASLSEMWRENIRTFTSLGNSKGFESGSWQGGAHPTGYYLKDKELFVDDSYRAIIELIFKLYDEEGYSVAGVVKYLLSMGIKRILDNPVYKDYFYFACKHRLLVEGAKCTFKNQIHQDRLTSAVYDIVKGTFSIDLSLDTSDATCGELHASYSDIKSWVLATYGVKVSSLYISQVKRSFCLDMGITYNVSKRGTSVVPTCPPEKFEMISSALRHFKIIS